VRVVLTSAPAEHAQRISRTLVEEGLAACIQRHDVTSVYRWKEAIQEDPETVLWIKASSAQIPRLTSRLEELHPYELPEILVLPVDMELSSSAYIAWVQENSRPT
jgi:periplasmic divalent cation tolerance protein